MYASVRMWCCHLLMLGMREDAAPLPRLNTWWWASRDTRSEIIWGLLAPQWLHTTDHWTKDLRISSKQFHWFKKSLYIWQSTDIKRSWTLRKDFSFKLPPKPKTDFSVHLCSALDINRHFIDLPVSNYFEL